MENSGIIEYHLSRSFSDKMNATYSFLRSNFKPFCRSLLFIAGPPVLIGGAFFIDIFQGMISTESSSDTPAPFALNTFGNSDYTFQALAFLLFMLIGGVFTVATTYAYMILYQKNRTTDIQVGEVWQQVRKTFWMNFGTMLLYYLFLIIALIVMIFPLAFLVYLFANVSPFLVLILYLLYLVFAFFLVINFSMIFFIRNYEGVGFFKSIDKFLYLNKGKWWSTFGIGGMNYYIQYIFSYLLIIPGYVVLFLNSMHKANPMLNDKAPAYMEIISSILLVLYFLGSVLLFALPLVGLAFQYFNLVEIKQAKGLMSKIDMFGTTGDLKEDFADY